MTESRAARPLGRSGVTVPALGVGTNRWGDSVTDQARLTATLTAAIDSGIGFIDTAEVYGYGRSEKTIAQAIRHDGRPLSLASKFLPLPYRVSAAQFASALDHTLERLGRNSLDIYYLHFPWSVRGVGYWMKAMARAVKAGKIRAVGISNCNAAQMRAAAAELARHDIPLAANQVHYSLLHRKPETNGVLDACRQMDVALVAWQPLNAGVLSAGSGGSALGDTLRGIATARRATVAQVALAWLLQRDGHVIAIPGATRPEHVRDNAGALTLDLSDEEFVALDRASAPAPSKPISSVS